MSASFTRKFKVMMQLKNILMWILLLLAGFGIGTTVQQAWLWYNKAATFIPLDTSAHFAETHSNVVIYTTAWCPYCKKLKQYLQQHQIAYDEFDIENTNIARLRLFEQLEAPGIPKIVTAQGVYIGFDPAELDEALGL